jgi:hypothetical protein
MPKNQNPRLPLSPLIVNLRTLAGAGGRVWVVMDGPDEMMDAIESALDDVQATDKLNTLVFAGFTPVGYLQVEGDTISTTTVVQQEGAEKKRQEVRVRDYCNGFVAHLERMTGCCVSKLKKRKKGK